MDTILGVGQNVLSIFSDALSILSTFGDIGTAIMSAVTGTPSTG